MRLKKGASWLKLRWRPRDKPPPCRPGRASGFGCPSILAAFTDFTGYTAARWHRYYLPRTASSLIRCSLQRDTSSTQTGGRPAARWPDGLQGREPPSLAPRPLPLTTIFTLQVPVYFPDPLTQAGVHPPLLQTVQDLHEGSEAGPMLGGGRASGRLAQGRLPPTSSRGRV